MPLSFCYLPEITDDTDELNDKDEQNTGSFWMQHRVTFGFLAQMCYV
jgi:hypothetical protein